MFYLSFATEYHSSSPGIPLHRVPCLRISRVFWINLWGASQCSQIPKTPNSPQKSAAGSAPKSLLRGMLSLALNTWCSLLRVLKCVTTLWAHFITLIIIWECVLHYSCTVYTSSDISMSRNLHATSTYVPISSWLEVLMNGRKLFITYRTSNMDEGSIHVKYIIITMMGCRGANKIMHEKYNFSPGEVSGDPPLTSNRPR